MLVLVDIGGTYARFAREEGGTIGGFQKYTAADFASFEDALVAYCNAESLKDGGDVLIGTAARQHGNKWVFINQNPWVLRPDNIKKTGWQVRVIINDFAAASWGLIGLDESSLEFFRYGRKDMATDICLTGPGTGLGLSYLRDTSGQQSVQETFGAHMLASAQTDEQRLILKTVRQLKGLDMAPVFEHLVSGPGLYNIYRAQCLINGVEPALADTAGLLEAQGNKDVHETRRLFHEFFGLHAQNAVITGHAFGGLYLTGGVMDRLMKTDLFDFEIFNQFFTSHETALISEALSDTPVAYVDDPNLALKGLWNYSHD